MSVTEAIREACGRSFCRWPDCDCVIITKAVCAGMEAAAKIADEEANSGRAYPTLITAQAAEIEMLRDCIADIDRALCNYTNGCSDPFEPVSKWDDESQRSFAELVAAYNNWYSANKRSIEPASSNSYQRLKRAEAAEARCDRLKAALEPFALCVYDDNGDLTIDQRELEPRHWRAARTALGERHE